jgi:hypothetical protein
MPACPPTSDAACRVDVRILALAIPAAGLKPDALSRADWRDSRTQGEMASQPWMWQHDTTLLVLDRSATGEWLLSELGFNPTYGYYTEHRRASYAWAREAVGAALSRAIRLGDAASLSAAAALDAWCSVAFSEQAVSR